MELREYWQIIRRRFWIVITLLLIVLVVSVLTRPTRAPVYQVTMRFVMGLEPEAKSGDYYAYDKYYTWLTAEYLIDDASELVRSSAFAQAVSDRLAGAGISVPAGIIYGSTQAGQLHRILAVSIVWGVEAQIGDIANAVADVLPREIARHFAQVGTSGVHASLIDPPAISPVGASLKEKLDVPIRLVLALVAGIALTFLLHYLDDTVHKRQELEQSGIAVLAEIPPVPHRSRLGLSQKRLP
jgi:capsular polysaccharide biosynthesis protein